MTDLFDTFGTDISKENDGVWLPADPRDPNGEAQIKIARIGNENYEQFAQKEREKRSSGFRPGAELPPEIARDILNKALARTILVDWKGITSGGKEVPYSYEKAYELLKDPAMKDFKAYVVEEASRLANYKAEREEKIEKNSKKSSDGNSTGQAN